MSWKTNEFLPSDTLINAVIEMSLTPELQKISSNLGASIVICTIEVHAKEDVQKVSAEVASIIGGAVIVAMPT